MLDSGASQGAQSLSEDDDTLEVDPNLDAEVDSSADSASTASSCPSPAPGPAPGVDIRQEYFIQQAKLFSHLERRFDRFVRRCEDEKARAKGQKVKRDKEKPRKVEKRKKKKKGKADEKEQGQVGGQYRSESPSAATSISSSSPGGGPPKNTPDPSIQQTRPSASAAYPGSSESVPQRSPASNGNMIGTTIKGAAGGVRKAAAVIASAKPPPIPLRPIASSSRSLSTTPRASARTSSKKKRPTANPDAMNLEEAVRVLRALEISNTASAYSLTLSTRTTKSSLPLRGRLALPTDPRKSPEVILVFADPDSPSAEIARSAGAAFVGGEDLFPRVLSGELSPTKVLATPGMMPAVQRSLARFLGPKGLMPVAKRGGVGEGEELRSRVREAGGMMEWKADKLGVVRAPVARMTFPIPSVDANIRAFVSAVRDTSASAAAAAADSSNSRKRQPSGILTARLETTNGPSIELNDVL